MTFGDCFEACLIVFSIVRDPLPFGTFISQSKPFISTSGVLCPATRFGTRKVMSTPRSTAKKSAARFSWTSGIAPGGAIIVPILLLIRYHYTMGKRATHARSPVWSRDERGEEYPRRETVKLGDIATIKTGNLNVRDTKLDGEY